MKLARHLDQALFDAAATHVAHAFGQGRTSCALRFEPGDGTRYEFMFVFPGLDRTVTNWTPELGELDEGVVADLIWAHGWYVGLAGLGTMYPWYGGPVDPGYALEKWAYRPNERTGIVMSRLLNAIADRLG